MSTPEDRHATETAASEGVVELVEEQAVIGVRERLVGRTRVATRTETRTEDVALTLASRDVEVTRVPVGRDLAPGEAVPETREEGDVTILPVLEEVVVVETRLRLVEEVHIRRRTTTEDVVVPVTLRRQVAEIEREALDPGPDSAAPRR